MKLKEIKEMGCINKKTIPNIKYEQQVKAYKAGHYFKYPEKYIKVPCRDKCINCLGKRVNTIAGLLTMEFLKKDRRGVFITITYDESKVPLIYADEYEDEENKDYIYETEYADFELYDTREGYTQRKLLLDYKGNPIRTTKSGEIIKLIKNIRRQIDYYNLDKIHNWDKDFKVLLCTEYGEEGDRPHAHGVLLGVTNQGNSFKKLLEKCWRDKKTHEQKGIVDVRDMYGAEAINYVAKYTTKQLNWNSELDPREKPKVWYSHGLEKYVIENITMKKLKEDNFKYWYGNRKWKVSNLSEYYVKKWHENKKIDYQEIWKQMEEEKIEHKWNEKGYTNEEVEKYLEWKSKRKAETRLSNLKAKGDYKTKIINDEKSEEKDFEEMIKKIEKEIWKNTICEEKYTINN